MCNNLKRALYLSLRYQFVTPLTSLVVVKPDSVENGDIKEADMTDMADMTMSKGSEIKTSVLALFPGIILIIVNYF